ncbi:hypothetical protein BDP27DRAFT_1337217 [Rhodocollybia butyracea]|uniref:Uncharacterized protein n=1 Tax=Rhodocollybia butyracea TaxID=206335 RepID=A0A9P5PEW0_9AGAR|nr:hypothetical protein BDP27DRAFT_1337217 [Rhodocollybia butyracea]
MDVAVAHRFSRGEDKNFGQALCLRYPQLADSLNSHAALPCCTIRYSKYSLRDILHILPLIDIDMPHSPPVLESNSGFNPMFLPSTATRNVSAPFKRLVLDITRTGYYLGAKDDSFGVHVLRRLQLRGMKLCKASARSGGSGKDFPYQGERRVRRYFRLCVQIMGTKDSYIATWSPCALYHRPVSSYFI